ncbi:MAG: PilZ domain-containing protein [Candidatus Omnitrophica bacterium]|nr:PilZ domain-containing protein [Candidatus Omnitrophota bacterium]
MNNEKRKNTRSLISFPIECSVVPGKEYFYTVTKDLSAGGVRILSDEFLSKNNCLKLNINLIDKVLGIKAKVVWCNKERASDRYYAGLKFVEIPEENKNYINSIVE